MKVRTSMTASPTQGVYMYTHRWKTLSQGTHTITKGGSCGEDVIYQQDCFSVQIGTFCPHGKNPMCIFHALQGSATGLRGIISHTLQDSSAHRYAGYLGNSTGYPLRLIVAASPLPLDRQWYRHDTVRTTPQAQIIQTWKSELRQVQSNRRTVAVFEKNEEVVEVSRGIVIKRTARRLHVMSIPQAAQHRIVLDVVPRNLLQTIQADIAQGVFGGTQFRIAHHTMAWQKQINQCRPKTHPVCRS